MDNVDFLPERVKQQRAKRMRIIRQVYLTCICAALLGLLGYLNHGRIQKAQGELDMLNERSINIQQQLAMRAALEQQESDLQIMKRIEEHLGSRVSTREILSELDRVMPDSVALTSINIDTTEFHNKPARDSGGAQMAGATGLKNDSTLKRVRVVITGLAPSDVDVATFIGQISANPLFDEVTMGYAKNVIFRGRNAREFQASFFVVR